METVGEEWPRSARRAHAEAHPSDIRPRPRLRIVADEPFDPTTFDWDSFLPDASKTVHWRVGQRLKRVFDLIAAAAGIVMLFPLLAMVALLVRVTSPGPVFYRSRYMGERGRTFICYKFRSMVENAEELKASVAHLNHMKGPAFKIRDDPRVTRIGRLLRKFSLDELPQLWNVLRGDMSLVGPRPPLPEEFARFSDWHKGKLAVKPGITCLWQINGRSEITDFDEWARLDVEYIESWSLWTDLKILVRTIPAVLHGRGAY